MANQTGSRDAQVANWEKHLASIIEQTNKNINYLSKSVKPHDVGSNDNDIKSYSRPMAPPPPPPPRSNQVDPSMQSRRQSAPLPPAPMMPMVAPLPMRPDHYQRQARDVINTSRGSGVTRPLQKHVEDDLTRRVGESVKRSVERAVAEKTHASQARVDRLSDQLDILSEDNAKVHKEYSLLSRSIATQDRMTKRLKEEWEKQRVLLQKLEAVMVQDIGWKQTTAIDLKMLQDQQTQDAAIRVTGNELRSAMEMITAKTMVAVDRATMAAKNSFESELSILKQEMNALKEENNMLRDDLKAGNESSRKFMSKFDEHHVKSVLSSAVQSHFNKVEATITKSVRSTMGTDLKRSEENINAGIADKLKDCLGREVLQGGGDFHVVIASIAEKLMLDRERQLSDNLSKSIISRLTDSNADHGSTTGDAFSKHLNILIRAQLNESNESLLRQVKIDIDKVVTEKAKAMGSKDDSWNSSKVKDLVDKSASRQVKELIKNQKTSSGKGIELLEPRLARLEKQVQELPSIIKDDEAMKSLETTCSKTVDELKSLSEINSKNEDKFDRISNDVSLLYNAIEIKCRRLENDSRTYTDAKVQAWNQEAGEMKGKIQITQSLCETLNSSLEILKQLGDRIDSLEENSRCKDQTVVMAEPQEANESLEEMKKDLEAFGSLVESIRDELSTLTERSENTDQRMHESEERFQVICTTSTDQIEQVRQNLTNSVATLQEKFDLLSKASTDIEISAHDSAKYTNTLHSELSNLKMDIEAMKSSAEKSRSSLADLAASNGKVRSLEHHIGVEVSGLRGEFVDLQDNVIDMNSASHERIETLVKEVRKEMSSMKGATSVSLVESDEVEGHQRQKATVEMEKDVVGMKTSMTEISRELDGQKACLTDLKSAMEMSRKDAEAADICVEEIKNQLSAHKQDIVEIKTHAGSLESSLNSHSAGSNLHREQVDAEMISVANNLAEIQSRALGEAKHREGLYRDLQMVKETISQLQNSQEGREEGCLGNKAIGDTDNVVSVSPLQENNEQVQVKTVSFEPTLTFAANDDNCHGEDVIHGSQPLQFSSIGSDIIVDTLTDNAPTTSQMSSSFSISESIEGSIEGFDEIESVSEVITAQPFNPQNSREADKNVDGIAPLSATGHKEQVDVAYEYEGGGMESIEEIMSFDEESVASLVDSCDGSDNNNNNTNIDNHFKSNNENQRDKRESSTQDQSGEKSSSYDSSFESEIDMV